MKQKSENHRLTPFVRPVEKENSDPAVKKEFEPAKNDKNAFKAEAKRIEKDGGVQNPNNYNKINSPGKSFSKKMVPVDNHF